MADYDRRKHPTLRRGASGGAVTHLQKRLALHLLIDDDDFIDGIFGPRTYQAVRRFQQRSGLVVDGIAGENTWRGLLREESFSAPRQQPGETSQTADRDLVCGLRKTDQSLVERVKRCFRNKDYRFLDANEPYELNIIGVRAASSEIDSFDDEVLVIFRDESLQMQSYRFPFTTDPGARYTQRKLLNPDGAAILQPGQYRDCYLIGKHRGKYDALVQRGGKVRVWRDGNRDERLDFGGRTYEGWFGINIHRARADGTTQRIGPHSAGCQVFQRASDFDFVMTIARRASTRHGNRFSYTLIEADDL